MSDSVRPHRRQPTRLPRPWDSPGKNTGVGCHFLLQCMKAKSESEVDQSCLTLATPWTAAYQAPQSMGFSRQKYWSGVPLPSPSHPSRSPQNTKLSSPCYIAASHWPSVSHMAMLIHQFQSPNSSPLLVSTCLSLPSASLFRSGCIFAIYIVYTLPGTW